MVIAVRLKVGCISQGGIISFEAAALAQSNHTIVKDSLKFMKKDGHEELVAQC
jgi:hypothetical protein